MGPADSPEPGVTPPQASRARSARRRPLARVLALLVLVSLFLLAALEGAFRLVLSSRGEAWSTEAGLARVEAVREALFKVDWRAAEAPAEAERVRAVEEKAEIILHPYFGFDIAAGQDDYSRTAELLRREKPEVAFDILVVGGSVSCLFVQHAQKTLIRALRRDPRLREKPIRVHSLGRGGYKQPQQLFIVSYALALGWRPEVVINIDGFNELALSNFNAQNGAHPFHPSLPHWAHLTGGRGSSPEVEAIGARMYLVREQAAKLSDLILARGLLRSAVLGRLAVGRLEGLRGTYTRLYGEYVVAAAGSGGLTVSGPPFKQELPAVLRTAVTTWADCSRSLAAVCAEHDLLYLHVLQPTLHDPGSKPLTQKEWAGGNAHPSWIKACREGYPRLREAGAALAARGVHFLDASMLFEEVEEDLYYDACHFTKEGSDLLALAVAAELLRLLP